MGSDPSRVARGMNPIRRRLQHPTSVPLHQPARNSWGSPRFEAQPHCTSPWSNPKPAQLEMQTQTPNSCQTMHRGSTITDDDSRDLRLCAPQRAAVPIPPAAPLASSPPLLQPKCPPRAQSSRNHGLPGAEPSAGGAQRAEVLGKRVLPAPRQIKTPLPSSSEVICLCYHVLGEPYLE